MVSKKLSAALEYAKAGFRIFPCHNVVSRDPVVCSCSKGKDCPRPGKHPRTKNGLHDASSDIAQVATWWGQWADANPALCMVDTNMAVIDVDTKVHKDGRMWLKSVEGDLPYGPRQHTPSGGQHLFFKIPEDANVGPRNDVCAPGVDVRAGGGYIMLEPSDHVAGGEYYFEDDLTDTEVPDCPQWLLDEIVMPETVGALDNIDFDAHERGRLESALNVIPAELGNDQWIMVVMGIHSAMPDEDGFQLALEWSQTSEEHNETEKSFRARWRSIKPGKGISLGYIYKLATEYGWVEPPPVSKEEGDDIISQFLAAYGGEDDNPPDDAVIPLTAEDFANDDMPASVLRNARVGVLGRYMDWVDDCNTYSDATELSLASGLSLFAVIFSQLFRVMGKTRPNVYVVGVCRAGGGKQAGLDCARDVLLNSSFAPRVGENDFGSGAAVIDSLTKGQDSKGVKLFIMDEFSEMLSQVVQEGRGAQAWKRDIGKKLLELYSASNGLYTGTARKGETSEVIYQPHANIYGVCTPKVYASLNGASIEGGLLSRFLFVNVPNRPAKLLSFDEAKAAAKESHDGVPDDITDPIERLKEWVTDRQADAGNLGGIGVTDTTVYDFEMTPAAYELRNQAIRAAEKQASQDGFTAALWVRVAEQATKFAMIRCLCSWMTGDMSTAPVLEETDMRWGLDLVLWSTRRLDAEIQKRAARNQVEANLKDVLRIIYAGRGAPVARSTVIKQCTNIPKKEIMSILDRLKEMGKIQETKLTSKRGRPPAAYIPTREDDEYYDDEEEETDLRTS